MHMDMWHTIIQCTVVLRLSPNDTRPYPNTLSIRSLPRVNFWVFHLMNLSTFLIRFTRAFTFHYCFIFLSVSISCTFHSFYLSFTQPWCKWNVMRLITLIHKYHQYHIKFPTSPYIIEITIILQLHNFPITSIILIIKYNYFLHTKITKNNPIISNNSNLN